MQSPDAAERNFAFTTGNTGSVGGVQSPDAAERNFGSSEGSSAAQSPDAADRNFAYASGDATATGGVQSPDALDRNLAHSGDDQSLSNVIPAGGTHVLGSEPTSDDGYLPTIGYANDATDAPEGTEIMQDPHTPH